MAIIFFCGRKLKGPFCAIYSNEVAYTSSIEPGTPYEGVIIGSWTEANGKKQDGGYVPRVVKGEADQVSPFRHFIDIVC